MRTLILFMTLTRSAVPTLADISARQAKPNIVSKEGNPKWMHGIKLPSWEGSKGWVRCHDCERLFDGILTRRI